MFVVCDIVFICYDSEQMKSHVGREHGAGHGERAADRQRLVGPPLGVPFLDIEVEPGSQ